MEPSGVGYFLAGTWRQVKHRPKLRYESLLSPDPIDIDFHSIPANPRKSEPEHYHIDLRFRLAPQVGAISFDRHEVDAAAWVDVGEVKDSRLYRVLSE
jgi:hypothetical protein